MRAYHRIHVNLEIIEAYAVSKVQHLCTSSESSTSSTAAPKSSLVDQHSMDATATSNIVIFSYNEKKPTLMMGQVEIFGEYNTPICSIVS